jgi:type I restriction enzyme S subunit
MSNATTHIEIEKQLAPALRFKEFEGEWSKKKLSKVCQVNPKAEKLPNSFIYVDLESVKKGVLGKEERINKIDAPSRAQRLLTKNDILYQTVRPYQKNNYFFSKNNLDYVASTGYAQIRTDNSAHYIFQLLHTELFVNKVLLRCTGTSYPAINSSDLKSIPINIPSLPEQQKIASFLSAVDKKIEQLTKKKVLLEQYKKGVMQQLFSGQLRFKDANGKAYPDWEEKKITELAKTSIGLVTSMTIHYVDNGVALIRNSDIKQNKVRKHKLINLAYAFAEENKNRQLLESDIVTVHTGDIGVSAVIDKELDGCQGFATLNTRINNQNDIAPEYLCWYFNSQKNIKYATAMSTGDGRSNYNLKDFNRAIIPVPVSEEQQKIASYLSGIVTKIESVNNQITQTQTFKKGLLQQMFV